MPSRHYLQLSQPASSCIVIFLAFFLLISFGCSRQPDPEQAGADDDQAGLAQEYVLLNLFDDDRNTIETRFGLLEVERLREEIDCFSSLLLDERPVYCTDEVYLFLHHYIQHGQRDLVLFLTDPGGTAYQFSHFWILVLEPGSDPLALTHKDFTALEVDVAIESEGDALVVHLGFESGWRKTARLQGRKLRVDLESVPDAMLSLEDCKWLHDAALAECMDLKRRRESCLDPVYGFSNAMQVNLLHTAEKPGFDMDRFISLCTAVCETGNIPDFGTFSRQVCGGTEILMEEIREKPCTSAITEE